MIAPVAAVAAAFDLVCAGTQMAALGDPAVRISHPFRETYRVDLESGRWCSGACASVLPLAEVSGSTIVFERARIVDGVSLTGTLDRQSGRLEASRTMDQFVYIRLGHCDRSAFTGFPAAASRP